MHFIRIKDVVKITGLSKATIWAWSKDGRMPQPFKLSERVTGWNKSDILEWIESKRSNS